MCQCDGDRGVGASEDMHIRNMDALAVAGTQVPTISKTLEKRILASCALSIAKLECLLVVQKSKVVPRSRR